MKFQHINGLTVNIINVHMKCCNGSEDRRRSGAVLLKDYIDTNLPNENVILLGDFNDEIVDQADNVYQTLVLKLDNCQSTFESQVSDHRPVMIRLNNN